MEHMMHTNTEFSTMIYFGYHIYLRIVFTRSTKREILLRYIPGMTDPSFAPPSGNLTNLQSHRLASFHGTSHTIPYPVEFVAGYRADIRNPASRSGEWKMVENYLIVWLFKRIMYENRISYTYKVWRYLVWLYIVWLYIVWYIVWRVMFTFFIILV